ncbi:type IV secretory system conjugative DNA transfer family protein [Anaerovibrio sp.]|uniref:type IV secretory system conjugative DNA transfer family protein n=1 Tax=Anaerovibrio sp. TaxID=1872532 RepID=UPI0025BBDE1E|nr:type IV secretory system conjugative DNA transfer family protein [Anaerovibrio sp.]MBR2142102.1 type IV secretory system conjugative DNA transfer family protein [Anaerovibrio sp.]
MDKNINEIFPLGEDKRCHISTDCTKTGLNNNIMVVGGSGSGKTLSVMLPMICNLESSNAVVVHTKRGIYDKTKKLLEEKGYNVLLLDLNDPTKSPYGYDPLLQCNSLADVRNLAHTIAYTESSKSEPPREPFWQQNAESILNLVLRYVYEGYYEKGNTMVEALSLLDYLNYADDDDVKSDPPTDEKIALCKKSRGYGRLSFLEDEMERRERIKRKYPLHGEMRNWYDIDRAAYMEWSMFVNYPDSTGGCVVGSTKAPLVTTFNSDIRNILGENLPQLDVRELLKPKTVLFIYVSPVNVAQHRFCSIIYQQLFKRLFELGEVRIDGMLPYPVHVLCDDFATGCKVQDFHELISIIREKGISATMLVQSESQLSSLYGKNDATTIINNCDTYIYLGGMDVDTAVNVSLRLNRPMNDVLEMPLGQELFFRRGQKPVVTKRYDTFKAMEEMKQQRKNLRKC